MNYLDSHKICNKKRKELKTAIIAVWAVISVTTTFILLFPIFANKQTVLNYSPTCISISKFNVECSLCGMTRAFIEISNGHFNRAYLLNKGSILVFSMFLINSISFLFYTIYYGYKIIQMKFINNS